MGSIRSVLSGLGVCGALLTGGCGSDGDASGTPSGGAGGDSGSAGNAATSGSGGSGAQAGSGGSGGGTPPAYDLRSQERQSCTYGPGSKTTETIGPNVPHGDALPFEHIVVLMQENRSFDQYFSKLPEYGVTDVTVATDEHFNYDPDTNPPQKIYRYHDPRYCVVDVNHEWNGSHIQYNNGAMDGFVSTNNPGGARAMGYYDHTDLPYLYWMSKTFAISDSHFCSLLGPTWPNRFYFYGATSWGNTKTGDLGFLLNNLFLISDEHQKAPKIIDQMDQAGKTWKIYRDGLVSFAIVFKQSSATYGTTMAQFEADVANDALPNLALIDPSFTGDGQNDDHPPANIQLGQQFIARVLGSLMKNPIVWKKTVFILIYDEHGGFYDSVPPPEACEPDNLGGTEYKFNRLGFRTPLIIASPYVKAGYVSHIVTDLTSVTRFIQNRFELPAMTIRDANAWPMLDMFDFDNPSHPTPPTDAPSGVANPAGVQYCKNNPPGTGMP
jgi:phospholipase C